MTVPSSDGDGPEQLSSPHDDSPVDITIPKPTPSRTGKHRRIAQKKPMPPLKKGLILLILCCVMYTLLGFFAAPALITSLVSSELEKKLNRPVTIGTAQVNPFRFDIILKNGIIGAKKDNPDDLVDPLFSFGRLKIKLQPLALFTTKPLFQAIHGNTVFLHIVRDKNQQFNLQPLLHQASGTTSGWSPQLLAQLKHIDLKLSDAKILFDDQESGTNHIISQISFRLPAGNNAAPHFSASINGSPIEFGSYSGQTPSGEQSFVLNLKDINLPTYLNYLPAPFPTLISKGKADLDLTLTSSYTEEQFNLEVTGTGIAHDIWMNDGKENHNKIDTATFNFSGNILDKRITLHKLVLARPELHISRAKNGEFFFPARASFSAAPSHSNLRIETVVIKKGKLVFIDQNIPGGFGASFNDVNLSIDVNKDNTSSYALNCITNRKTRIASQGTIHSDSWQLQGLLILNDLPLPALNSYLTKPGGISITSGIVDKFETSFSLSPLEKHKLTGLASAALSIRNLSLNFKGEEMVTIPSTKLNQASYSTTSKTVQLGNVQLHGGRFNLSPSSPLPIPAYKGEQDTVWKINKLTLNKNMVHLRGFELQEKPQTIVISTLTASNLSSNPKTTAQITTDITMLKSARANAKGTVKLNPLRSRLDIKLDKVALLNIPAPLVNFITPSLLGGTLSAQGTFSFPKPSFKGTTTIKRLKLRFGQQRELLTIQDLQLADGIYTFSPLQVTLRQINMIGLHTGLPLSQKKLFNQDDFFNLPAETAAMRRLSIGAIRLTNGALTFKDPTLTPPFAYTIEHINGHIGPLDSSSNKEATLSFTGSSRNQNSFSINGTSSLLRDHFKTDLTISIKDFPLTDITPFVEPITGYGILGGLFDLQIGYHEDQGIMTGETKLDIRHLTLSGEEKGNGQFPDIVALLTDSNHHIQLNIPLSGETTDPSYTFRSAYAKKLRELTLATMVSPYSALGDYFNENQTPPNKIIFLPGTSELAPEQNDILLSLQTIIKNRPLLHITFAGYSGSKEDRAALLTIKKAQKDKKAQEQAIASGNHIAKDYGKELITKPQTPIVLPPKITRLTKQELQDLALKRSKKMKDILVGEYGIDQAILHIDTTPTVLPESDTNTQGHRVEFVLSGPRR